MEDAMTPFARLVPVVTGLVMLLNITPSWGQTPVCVAPGCNPTVSDENGNTASGSGALVNNPTGSNNTASGSGALSGNTTGSTNTASGVNALTSNTTGSGNTASGVSVLSHNTAGNDNVATGENALLENLIGSKNTAIGTEALVRSTGNKNIAIGFRAGIQLITGHNNVYLDNRGSAVESQTMRLGDSQERTFIAGIVTADVNGATVEIDANGQLGIKNSSARYKRDVAPMGTSSDKVLALRPVTFVYKDDAQGVTRYGLIAEEVATVYPELVTRTASGEVQTVKYHELIPMLLNELQREHQEIAMLKQELAELATIRRELVELRSLVGTRVGQ
jgi:hypothetical protein